MAAQSRLHCSGCRAEPSDRSKYRGEGGEADENTVGCGAGAAMPHASRSRLESPRLLAVVPLRSICVSRLEPSCLLAVASRKQLELEGPLTEFGEVVIGLGRMAASHAHPLYAGSTKRFGACVPETTTRPDRRWSSPCSSNRGTVLPCSCLLSHGDARSALVNIFECAERAHARSARPGGCSIQPARYVGSSSQGTSRAIEIRMAGLLLTNYLVAFRELRGINAHFFGVLLGCDIKAAAHK